MFFRFGEKLVETLLRPAAVRSQRPCERNVCTTHRYDVSVADERRDAVRAEPIESGGYSLILIAVAVPLRFRRFVEFEPAPAGRPRRPSPADAVTVLKASQSSADRTGVPPGDLLLTVKDVVGCYALTSIKWPRQIPSAVRARVTPARFLLLQLRTPPTFPGLLQNPAARFPFGA
jgi:hypothetical protein